MKSSNIKKKGEKIALKPSEVLDALYAASQRRYATQDIDTRQIASISNLVKKIGEILDEQETRISNLEK